MAFQRENVDHAANEVVKEAESVLEGTPVVEPDPVPAPPTEVPRPDKKEDPEVTPMCCGQTPKFMSSAAALTTGGSVHHDANCPNHPDNAAAEVPA
ncbi:hypothetical protein ACFWN2_41335 [Lentzea sp. NPDC058436]|uniref:hypothetical protein n=1 Tax=Lentzea sp. NPDC058436 TaxID=3346499 RepID=UPI00365BF135